MKENEDSYKEFKRQLKIKEARDHVKAKRMQQNISDFMEMMQEFKEEKEQQEKDVIKNWIKDIEEGFEEPLSPREKMIAKLAFDRGVSYGRCHN